MPTSLALAARGGGQLITRAAMMHPQYRYARAAYRYGPTAARAAARVARFVYSRYRRRRKNYTKRGASKRARLGIGERIGSSNSKRVVALRSGGADNFDTRTLYSDNLTTVDHLNLDARNVRQREVVNCRGFKICMSARNSAKAPLYWNVAVLSPKNAGSITAANFFRSDGESRARDFDLTLNSLEFHCLPINTDKFYILKHKRYRLAPEPANSGTSGLYTQSQGKNYVNVDWYVPLKRQLRYDDPESTSPIDGATYLVHWCDTFNVAENSGTAASAMQITSRHIMYFREPRT